jgi:hypothetical protein
VSDEEVSSAVVAVTLVSEGAETVPIFSSFGEWEAQPVANPEMMITIASHIGHDFFMEVPICSYFLGALFFLVCQFFFQTLDQLSRGLIF